MDKQTRAMILKIQRLEATEHVVYMRLAELTKDKHNAGILREIGTQEAHHAAYWKKVSGVEVGVDRWRVFRVVWMARILGLSFVLKLMEKREGTGSRLYDEMLSSDPEMALFAEEEREHEKRLLAMLDEEGLRYVGSIVLGLNDALVELTGALAGFTLALGDTALISMAGLVTGISAAFSMAASDYLSSKAEGDVRAKRSALYTGLAYFFTVILLILPFLLIPHKFIALGVTLAAVVLIIFAFNFYIATAKDLDFKSRFWEMTAISFGVAIFSFGLGYVLKMVLGVDA